MAARSLSRRAFATRGFLSQPKSCSIIGAPFSLGQPLDVRLVAPTRVSPPPHVGARVVTVRSCVWPGVELGPQAIRDSGALKRITAEGWRIKDVGDLSFRQAIATLNGHDNSPNLRNSTAVGAANKLLADTVFEHASQGRFVLTLGGDHSVGIGSIAGIMRARPDVGIIWVVREGARVCAWRVHASTFVLLFWICFSSFSGCTCRH